MGADVIYNPRYENADGSKGAYMIYYPVCSNHKRGAIGYAVSQSITGPYQYGDTILYSGFTLTGGPDEEGTTADTIWTRTNLPELIENGTIEGLRDSWFNEDGSYNIVDHAMPIDPAVFFDEDGRLWMVYGGAMLIELDPGHRARPSTPERTAKPKAATTSTVISASASPAASIRAAKARTSSTTRRAAIITSM